MTAEAQSSGRPWRKNAVRSAVTVLFVAAAALGMWRTLAQGFHGAVIFLHRSDSATWMVTASLVNLAGLTLGMVSWRSLLGSLGHSLPWGPTLRVYGAAMLGKYLPGPFWSGLASVHMGRSSGVPAGRMVAAYALNSVLVLLTAGVVGLCAAPEVLGHGTLWLVPAVLLLLVLFGQPRLISRMAHLTAVVLRRPRVDTGLADGPLRWSIASQVMSWIVGGLHVPLIIAALGGPVGWRSLLMSLGGFALAAAAGMLTLVVPDGAGVREVVLTTALAPVLSLKEAATVAVLSRLCCTAGEVLGSAAALVTAGWMARRRTAPIPGPEKAQTVPSSSV